MPTSNHPPVRVDVDNEWVWVGEQQVRLTPKAFAVLRYLAERSGRLVSKDEILRAVWADTVVSEWALTSCLREIRKALQDEAKAPRFIETVHRRGYRWIAPLTTQPVASSQYPVVSRKHSENSPLQLATGNWQLTTRLVGREAELAYLHERLEKAVSGERQIVFVTGEPGIGKTTLVDAFLERVRAEDSLWLGQGQCIEHFGAGEAYLPVLEALGQLCRQPRRAHLIELLRRYAPTWLVQLPWLLDPVEQERVQRQVLGATRERMLREMAELVQALTTETPVILVLEDLQWVDYSTLDLLSFLTRRRETARLFLIGTYRPVDVILRDHPLRGVKQDLLLHEQCTELALELLTEKAVAEYLAGRFAAGATDQSPLRELARRIHQRTDGNPLFMVNVVNYLVAQGLLGQDGVPGRVPILAEQQGLQERVTALTVSVPESVQQMIEVQLVGLKPEERRMLEAASVGGVEFTAPTVAAALQEEVARVEEWCEGLARRGQFLRPVGVGEWPDGTVVASYRFLHALYQETLYEQVTATRRVELHRRIGERHEAAYGDRVGEVAAELAVHFEAGREYDRAVQYHREAAETARRRSAHREATNHLTRGLELLQALPATPEHTQHELRLQTALCASLTVIKSYGAPEVERASARVQELCQQVGETAQVFPALGVTIGFHIARAELQTAHELGDRLLRLAQKEHDPALILAAHQVVGSTLFHLGEFTSARAHLEQGAVFYNPQQHYSLASLYGHEPEVLRRSYAALVLWELGFCEQALKRSYEALTLAQELTDPYSLAVAGDLIAMVHQFRGEAELTHERAGAAMAVSSEQGFLYWSAWGAFLQGWALAEQGYVKEGLAQMHQGLTTYRAMGSKIGGPYWLALLTEAYGKAGQVEEGLSVLKEALATVDKSRECWREAELHRLKGELSLKSGVRSPESKVPSTRPLTLNPQAEAEAEACFQKAIGIAQQQSAKSLELRAVMSLARLWQRQGKGEEARPMLAEIYGWFTEGFDTADLQEAKALLTALLP